MIPARRLLVRASGLPQEWRPINVGQLGVGQVLEELFQASSGCFVSFDLTRPAAGGGVVDELLLHFEAGSEAGRVVAGGEEFGAGQDQVAFAGSFGRGT